MCKRDGPRVPMSSFLDGIKTNDDLRLHSSTTEATPGKHKTIAWQYFYRIAGAGICQVNNCGRQIKTAGGSTSGLHAHLKTIHKINLLKRPQDDSSNDSPNHQDPGSTGKKQQQNTSIGQSAKKEIDCSLSAVIARMVVKDGLSFNTIANSVDINCLLASRNYPKIPKCPMVVRRMVIEYAERIQKQAIEELNILLRSSKKFSITLDEWTTNRKRHRYVSVNIFSNSGTFWNLGLARVTMQKPLTEVLRSKLAHYGLQYEDVVSVTSTVENSLVCSPQVIRQMCLAHVIQIALVQIFYCRDISLPHSEDLVKVESSVDAFDAADSDDEIDYHRGLELVSYDPSTEIGIKHVGAQVLVQKIRKVIKIIQKMNTRNSQVIRNNMIKYFGKERNLVTDTKYKWNGLLEMLERFDECKDCIIMSLIDLRIDLNFTETDLEMLQCLIASLQPVKVAIETLCAPQTNLLSADVCLKFLLDELTKQNNDLSLTLRDELIKVIKERRTRYSDVLQFLHNPTEVYAAGETEDYEIFNQTSSDDIMQLLINSAEHLTERKVKDEPDADPLIFEVPLTPEPTSTYSLTMKERLHLMIEEKINSKLENPENVQDPSRSDLEQIIHREIKTFCDERIRGQYLEMVYKHLTSIKPTSIQLERAFSTVGLFSTKIISDLNDDDLNALWFLKGYFS